MPETIYKDPETGKRYKVRYEGATPPDESAIRAELFPNRGAAVIPAPRQRSTVERVLGVVRNVGAQVVSGLAGGGYENVKPLPRRSTGNVTPPPDPLLLAMSPVAVPVMKAASTVGNSVRNFAQGALAPGLARYDASPSGQAPGTSVLGNVRAMASPIFKDVPGNVRGGVSAVRRDDGDKRIGKAVPDLAPDTLAGGAYNLLTAAGSDPMNLLGAAAPKLAAETIAIANRTAQGRKVVAGMKAVRALARSARLQRAQARCEALLVANRFPVSRFLPRNALPV